MLDKALEANPDNPRALLTLAEAQAAAGDVVAAEATLDSLPVDEQANPEVVSLRNHLFFEVQVAEAPGATELEARLAADPDDAEALFQLALHKVVAKNYVAAMDLLLQLMQKDRSYADDAGRRGLLKVFELLGDDPRVGEYRRRMATLLH